jgi:hypothetical protein
VGVNRRRYVAAVGAALLAGCASPDGDPGRSQPTTTGPPTLAFGESYLLSNGVELSCGGVETADTVEMDEETLSAPEGRTWALVDLTAENRAEEARTLPWRQAISVRYGDRSFRHDVNDTPTDFLFWDGGYTGGEAVDPGTTESGVVPVAVDPDAVAGDAAVVDRATAIDADSEVWWTAQ